MIILWLKSYLDNTPKHEDSAVVDLALNHLVEGAVECHKESGSGSQYHSNAKDKRDID